MSTRLEVFQNEETEMAVKAGNRGAAVKGQLYQCCLYQKSALKKEPVDGVSPTSCPGVVLSIKATWCSALPCVSLGTLSTHGFHITIFIPPLHSGHGVGTRAYREKRNESMRQSDLITFYLDYHFLGSLRPILYIGHLA